MVKTRTGARSFLDLMRKACRLSHTGGFANGLITILGDTRGAEVFQTWQAMCTLTEELIAIDDWFNRVDSVAELEGDEDIELI